MMFLAIITSRVRKELESIGFTGYQCIEFVKFKKDVYFFSLLKDDIFYTVRFYEGKDASLIYKNCKCLENIGINIIKIVAFYFILI